MINYLIILYFSFYSIALRVKGRSSLNRLQFTESRALLIMIDVSFVSFKYSAHYGFDLFFGVMCLFLHNFN